MGWSPTSATSRSRPGATLALAGLVAFACAAEDVGQGSDGSGDPDASAGSTGRGGATGTGAPVRDDDAGLGSAEDGEGEGTTSGEGDGPRRPASRAPELRFVDVTADAGLDVHPGPQVGAPACVLDDVTTPDLAGDFCFPERYLGAAAAADYDADGDVDLYLTRADGPDRLMRNDGQGAFEDVAAEAGLEDPGASGAAAWLDVEGDGDLDLFVTSVGGARHSLWINDGTGRFVDEADARGVGLPGREPQIGMGIGVGDYDLDGDLDLFVAAWRPDKPMGGEGPDRNRLLRNRGPEAPGTFEDVTEAEGIELRSLPSIVDAKPGVYGFAPAFVDLDGDRWPELTLTADFGTSRLWWNDRHGHFTESTWASGVGTERNGMGSTFGDVDGDGDLDWFVSAIWTDEFPELGHRLYRNDGGRTFSDVTDAYGLRDAGWGWGAALFDADLDGDLDLAMAAGWPYLGYDADPMKLWLNEGAPPWIDRAAEAGVELVGDGRGVLPVDVDRDGDLDLLALANGAPPRLFRNEILGDELHGHADGGPGWLVVQAQGLATNPRGLGVRLELRAEPDAALQVREITGGTQLFGQPEPVAHFGLGEGDAPIHELTVRWPVTGHRVTLKNVPRNQRLTVTE